MKLGIFSTSLKENEKRAALHPEHIVTCKNPSLVEAFKKQIYLEEGYGERFGYKDNTLAPYVAGFKSRDELFKDCDALLLPKPVEGDFKKCKEGQIVWGWIHLCAQPNVVDTFIEKKLTTITFEAMHEWDRTAAEAEQKGEILDRKHHWVRHTFANNNKQAGYCAVHHSLNILGRDGIFGQNHQGKPPKVAVLGRGNCSIGAVWALHGRGFTNIKVFSHQAGDVQDNFSKSIAQVPPPNSAAADDSFSRFGTHVEYLQVAQGSPDRKTAAQDAARGDRNAYMDVARLVDGRLVADELVDCDIIVNAILQNPTRPMMFLRPSDVPRLKPRSIIIDVSCDEGMGFPFAKPTTFEDPLIVVPIGKKYTSHFGHPDDVKVPEGHQEAFEEAKAAVDQIPETPISRQEHTDDDSTIFYTAVDHTPSMLFDAATRDISKEVMDHMMNFLEGFESWEKDITLKKAIEIQEGQILFSEIISVQNREDKYPYKNKK